MSSPKTLKEFLIWAMTNYPSERSIVVFTNHGEAWMDALVDETSRQLMDPVELKNTLEDLDEVKKLGRCSSDLAKDTLWDEFFQLLNE